MSETCGERKGAPRGLLGVCPAAQEDGWWAVTEKTPDRYECDLGRVTRCAPQLPKGNVTETGGEASLESREESFSSPSLLMQEGLHNTESFL